MKTFKHKKTGEIATYKDGVLTSSGFSVEIGVEPSSEFWDEIMENNIVYNAIQTPDGTILQSKHRHDYVTYTDKNGQHYSVDGGLQYLRRGYDKPDYIELSKTFKECTLDECTKYLHWGQNYDANMNRLPETIFKPICELNTDHIEAILKGGFCSNEMYLKVFAYELNKRKKSCADYNE